MQEGQGSSTASIRGLPPRATAITRARIQHSGDGRSHHAEPRLLQGEGRQRPVCSLARQLSRAQLPQTEALVPTWQGYLEGDQLSQTPAPEARQAKIG